MAFQTPLAYFSQKDLGLKCQPLSFGPRITGLRETQQKMGNIGPICPLLVRTRLPLEASHTFRMIIITYI